ncbi:MAG: ribonuclease P protein component [Candidatus Cloacimonetes bacterium]|nr:ribonuclease P protein component [Candidatus Cloacimonadota bacterium]
MRWITSGKEFKEIYQKHYTLSGDLFIVFVQRSDLENDLAVGIITNKKIGKAVIRNKVKRRVRSFLRQNVSELKGIKLIIKAKPEAARASWQEICLNLGKLLFELN